MSYRRRRGLSETGVTWLAGLFIACIVIIPNIFLFNQWQDCNAKDGAFVRTAFWYACIETK